MFLLAFGRGVDQGLGAEGIAVHVVALGIDAIAGAVLKRLPGHDVAAVRERSHGRIPLIACGRGADAGLAADGIAIRIVALGIDAVAGAVLAVRRPGHDVAAVRERGHGRRRLVAGGRGVDAGLAADGIAIRIVALGIDAPAGAVLVRLQVTT